MRQEYEMTEEDYQDLLRACEPPMYIIANGTEPMSQQERVNLAWASLGRKMGFDGKTAQPSVKGKLHFTAESAQS